MSLTIKNPSQKETNLLTTLSAQSGNIFRLDDAQKVLDLSPGHTWKLISALTKKGWLQPIERGIYLIVPFEGAAAGNWSEEPFVIASYLVNPHAIAYWSALNYYNYTEQISRTIFIETTTRKFKSETEVLGVPYRFITLRPHKYFGFTRIWYGNRVVNVTDKEKTIIDCLDHPEYCGGIVEIAKGLAAAFDDGIDLEKLTQYAQLMNNRAIFKRLGYLAEVLELPTRDYSSKWRNMISAGYALLDPLSTNAGTYNSHWNIKINMSDSNLTEWRQH